jgi:hypothetical protein
LNSERKRRRKIWCLLLQNQRKVLDFALSNWDQINNEDLTCYTSVVFAHRDLKINRIGWVNESMSGGRWQIMFGRKQIIVVRTSRRSKIGNATWYTNSCSTQYDNVWTFLQQIENVFQLIDVCQFLSNVFVYAFCFITCLKFKAKFRND